MVGLCKQWSWSSSLWLANPEGDFTFLLFAYTFRLLLTKDGGTRWLLYLFIFQPHCTVPTYSSAVSAMAIHPTTNCLFITHADQQVMCVSIHPSERLGHLLTREIYWDVYCLHMVVCLLIHHLNTHRVNALQRHQFWPLSEERRP